MTQDHPSLELCKKLAEAGIDFPDSERVWVQPTFEYFNERLETWDWDIKPRTFSYYPSMPLGVLGLVSINFFPAPSLAELLERLPVGYAVTKRERSWVCGLAERTVSDLRWRGIEFVIYTLYIVTADTPQNAAALMLLKVKENG
jgi:hypothetical protein